MSPDYSLMNMDYVGIISDGGGRKAGMKTCPNDLTFCSENRRWILLKHLILMSEKRE
jgi:hypothetical protein